MKDVLFAGFHVIFVSEKHAQLSTITQHFKFAIDGKQTHRSKKR
jgi:hypothetical protein